MRSSTRLCATLLPLLLPAALLLSGCSTGSTDASPAETPGPLDPYYTALYGGPDDEEELDRQNREIQDAIAACMTAQGFEYEPDAAGSSFVMVSDDEGPAWGSEEFAKTYGYGITINPPGFSEDSGEDPNAAYVESLSPGERAAYEEALWGAPVSGEAGSEGESGGGSVEAMEFDWTTAGCSGAAQHEVMGESDFHDDPEFADLVERMDGLYQQAIAAPAVEEAERRWLDCMADAGHDALSDKDDPMSQLFEEFEELRGGSGTASGSGSGGSTSGTSTSAPDVDPAALKELQQKEIALATSDAACARESGYTDALATETTRLEQRFVDENREQLDALVARYGRG